MLSQTTEAARQSVHYKHGAQNPNIQVMSTPRTRRRVNHTVKCQQQSTPRRSVVLAIPLSMQLLSQQQSKAQAATSQGPPLQCPATVSSLITAAFQKSLAAATASCKDLAGVDYTGEVQKLLQREAKYALSTAGKGYGKPQQAGFPLSGKVEHKMYDLVSYISWKVIASHVRDPATQAELCRNFALSFLACISPEALEQAGAGGTHQTEVAVYNTISSLLESLQQNGYICRFQVIWDEQPGTWPQDWMEKPTQEGRQPEARTVPDGLGFQIKLYQPADLEGSIALRSEEEAFWPNTGPLAGAHIPC